MQKRSLVLGVVLFFCTGFLFAVTINVPSDYSTNQDAIDIANDVDTILVQPGTYYENITYDGKSIVVGSLYMTTADTSYISNTIIDAGGYCFAVFINEIGQDFTPGLIGFTVTNGNNESAGGILSHWYILPPWFIFTG